MPAFPPVSKAAAGWPWITLILIIAHIIVMNLNRPSDQFSKNKKINFSDFNKKLTLNPKIIFWLHLIDRE
jgi:hypothetical protein